eukprot:CAMPEP_0197192720 /NCGR_PEP_ID=MMETSP1423-20130617/25589_1 /TAXON_ID=476441 /ORGANISM="Pseudo-nitzschia heimii, Strain UNC1101" /LENGTH=1160 /DNA_ID=CAMNT_0042645669 /DNA_START=57 /DNA_END=3539 /DNA_ORIENTATION=+
MLGTEHSAQIDAPTSIAMSDLSLSSIAANGAANDAASISASSAIPSTTSSAAALAAASATSSSTGFDLINHAIRMGTGNGAPTIASTDDERSKAANPRNQEILLKARLLDQKIAATASAAPGTTISRGSSFSTVGAFSWVSPASSAVGNLSSLVRSHPATHEITAARTNPVRQQLDNGGIVAALQQRHHRPSAMDVSDAANLQLQQQLRMYSYLGEGATAAAARLQGTTQGDTHAAASEAVNRLASSQQQSNFLAATESQQKKLLGEQDARQLNPNAFQFPWKLHDMLDRSSSEGSEDVVSWVDNGEAFRVHLPDAFVQNVMPRFFKQTKYKSFQRQLNLYGFTRLHNGPNKGGYKHKYFRQGQCTLCQLITRCPIRDSSSAATSMATSITGDIVANRLIMNNNEKSNRMIVEEGNPIKNGTTELINPSSAAAAVPHVTSSVSISSKTSSSSLKNKPQHSSDSLLLRQQHNAAIMAAHQKNRLEALTNSLQMLEKVRQEHQLQQLQVQQYEAHRLQQLKLHQQKQIESSLTSSYVPGMSLAGTNHSAYPRVSSLKLSPSSSVLQLTNSRINTDSPNQILDSSNNSSLQSSEADASLVSPNGTSKTFSEIEEKYIWFHKEFQFPWKLYGMLERSGEEDFSHLVSWMPGDNCFKVHDADQFVEKVMPRFFKQTKYKSFQRQLNLYGFIRVDMGPNKGGYRHPRFIRGRKDLLALINRIKIKGNGRPRSDRSNSSAVSFDTDSADNANNLSEKEEKTNSITDNATEFSKSEKISGIAVILEAIKTKEGKKTVATAAPVATAVPSSCSSMNLVHDRAETSSDNSTIPSTIDVQMKDLSDLKNGNGLSWRQNPSESFSDWTIEVIEDEIGEPNRGKPTVYHVHRRVLAVGPRKSEYFAKIFKSNSSANRTILKLTKREAAVFALALDYVYADIDLDLDAEKAYGLYSLGERLENHCIIQTVTDYYSKYSMTKDYLNDFFEVGRNFKNKTLLEAAFVKCSQEIWSMDDETVAKIDPKFLTRILLIATSVAQNGEAPQYDSLKLSQMVAHFITRSATKMTLTIDVFQSLTAKSILPYVDPIAAIRLLAAQNFLSSTSSQDRQSLVDDDELQKRCVFSIRKHWKMVHNRVQQSTELSNVMGSLSPQVLFGLLMSAKTLTQETESELVI